MKSLTEKRDPIVAPFHVIAFDPGGTTGWARVIYTPNRVKRMSEISLDEFKLSVGEFTKENHHSDLYNFMTIYWLDYSDLSPEFVTEPFNYRQYADAKRSDVELISCEYIGVMRLFIQNHSMDLPHAPTLYDRFNAGQAKDYVTNEKLAKMGWLQAPPTRYPHQHRNDALRQVVKYLMVIKKIRHPITSAWMDEDAA